MTTRFQTRRELLQQLGSLGLLLFVSSSTGCRKTTPCDSLYKVPKADRIKRYQLKYVSRTPHEGKTCDNCNLYITPKQGQCGGCTLFKGPVHPKAYCLKWVQKTNGSTGS